MLASQLTIFTVLCLIPRLSTGTEEPSPLATRLVGLWPSPGQPMLHPSVQHDFAHPSSQPGYWPSSGSQGRPVPISHDYDTNPRPGYWPSGRPTRPGYERPRPGYDRPRPGYRPGSGGAVRPGGGRPGSGGSVRPGGGRPVIPGGGAVRPGGSRPIVPGGGSVRPGSDDYDRPQWPESQGQDECKYGQPCGEEELEEDYDDLGGQFSCTCFKYVEYTMVFRRSNTAQRFTCNRYGLARCSTYCDELFRDPGREANSLQEACDVLGRNVHTQWYRKYQVCGAAGPYEDIPISTNLCCRFGRPAVNCDYA